MQAWFEVRNEFTNSATLLGLNVEQPKIFDGDETAKVIKKHLDDGFDKSEFVGDQSTLSVRFLFVGDHMTYDHSGPKSASRSILDYGWVG